MLAIYAYFVNVTLRYLNFHPKYHRRVDIQHIASRILLDLWMFVIGSETESVRNKDTEIKPAKLQTTTSIYLCLMS